MVPPYSPKALDVLACSSGAGGSLGGGRGGGTSASEELKRLLAN